MEQSLQYHLNTLEQMRATIDLLVAKPFKHELDVIKLAAEHRQLRDQITSAMFEGLEAFDSDTYAKTNLK